MDSSTTTNTIYNYIHRQFHTRGLCNVHCTVCVCVCLIITFNVAGGDNKVQDYSLKPAKSQCCFLLTVFRWWRNSVVAPRKCMGAAATVFLRNDVALVVERRQ